MAMENLALHRADLFLVRLHAWHVCDWGLSILTAGDGSGPPCSARRFGGASALEDDRAGRRVAVDEHGIARRASDDIWSAATSR